MSKEFDTSWFDLKNYDKLNMLDLHEWYGQISFREYLLHHNNANKSQSECIKKNPIIVTDEDRYYDGRGRPIKYSFNTSSVESMSAYDLWENVMIQANELHDVWKCCGSVLCRDATDEQKKLAYTPWDLVAKERNVDSAVFNIVGVDLGASDEQIMNDFRHWLTEYRKFTGYESPKKNFTDKDLSEWVAYRVIPYIDLKIIANFEGKTIKQAKMARLIFPDEYDIDITERLRRTTKPKADWLFSGSTITAILAQIQLDI